MVPHYYKYGMTSEALSMDGSLWVLKISRKDRRLDLKIWEIFPLFKLFVLPPVLGIDVPM